MITDELNACTIDAETDKKPTDDWRRRCLAGGLDAERVRRVMALHGFEPRGLFAVALGAGSTDHLAETVRKLYRDVEPGSPASGPVRAGLGILATAPADILDIDYQALPPELCCNADVPPVFYEVAGWILELPGLAPRSGPKRGSKKEALDRHRSILSAIGDRRPPISPNNVPRGTWDNTVCACRRAVRRAVNGEPFVSIKGHGALDKLQDEIAAAASKRLHRGESFT